MFRTHKAMQARQSVRLAKNHKQAAEGGRKVHHPFWTEGKVCNDGKLRRKREGNFSGWRWDEMTSCNGQKITQDSS